ncbi:MAG: tetratricopeptide repeat protein [Chitinophagaceae bacterium]
MFLKVPAILLLITLLFTKFTVAQDSITIKDAEEIRYKSESLIKREFRDLLNNIANADIELAETKLIISNAHSGTRNKIFYSPRVLLEDDINPNFHSSNTSRDIEVEKYLNDFDLLYKKSDAPSVSFNDVKASNIKKGKNLYVKVFFSSFFRNANKTNDTAYTINNRVAEIRVEKEKGKWAPYIARVGFFNPADTANDLGNDIVLLREAGNAGTRATTSTDSAAIALAQQNFEQAQKETARREAIEEDRKETQSFNDLVSKGDKALDINDFTGSLKFYKEAKDLRPYDPLPQSRINNANKVKERATITSGQLYEQYIHKATLAENKREYQAAIGFYNDAIVQKPDEAARYQNKKRELTEKFRITSELDEKYKAGLYKEAIKEYDAAIKKNKTNADLYLGRAKCYEKMNEFSKAMKDYTQSYELDNNNLEAIEKRAALYKKNGDNFKSLTDYKTYLTISKENTAIYEAMSELRMLINTNTDDAIKDLNDGLAVDPKATNLYLKKGLLLLRKNDLRGADNNFSSVIKLDSNHATAYYYRGKSQVLMNHAETAGVDFEAARQKGLDAENIKNIDAYAAAYFQRSVVKFNDPVKDSAIKLAGYAIAINPLNSNYRFSRGEYYFAASNYKEAINNYDQALLLDKTYTEAFYKRGLAWQNLGNHKTAIENYTGALQLSPQLYAAQKGMGDAYLALAAYDKAANCYENFFQLTGSSKTPVPPNLLAEVYNSMGTSYAAVQNNEKALAAFKNAVKKNPSMPEALFNRGLSFCKNGELADGIADMTKAVSFDNSHYQWHYYLGKAYQDKKDFQNAAVCFNNCIRLDTATALPDAVYYRGYNNYLMQNYTVALRDYEKIYPLYTNAAGNSVNYEMGNIYLNLSKYDSAYEFYNRAFVKDSGNGAAMYGMGSALLQKGKPDDALTWFEKSFQTKKVNYNDVKKDKLIAAIKDDKRFKALLKKYY